MVLNLRVNLLFIPLLFLFFFLLLDRNLNNFLFLLFLFKLHNFLRFDCDPLRISTSHINPLEYLRNDRFRIKPMNLLKQFPLLIMHSRIRKRSTFDMIPTKLRIPLTIEIVNLETPLLLDLQLVEHILQIPAVRTMRSEIFYKFETLQVTLYHLRELDVRYQVRIWHVPLFTTQQD